MTVAEETVEASRGDCVFIPSSAQHGPVDSGDGSLRYLSSAPPPFGAEKEKELWPLPPVEAAQ